MTLFRHALKNIRKEWAAYFLSMLQLSAIIVITLAMVSSLMLRYRYYAAFKDVMNENTVSLFPNTPAMTRPDKDDGYFRLLHDEDLKEIFPEAENILTCNAGNYDLIDESGRMLVDTMVNDYRASDEHRYGVTTLLYDDELLKRCQPDLSKGRQLKTSDKADCIEGIISSNYLGINVGDTVRMTAALDPFAEQPFKGVDNIYRDETGVYWGEIEVKIVGMIRENANVMGYTAGIKNTPMTITDFYGGTNLEKLDHSVLIFSLFTILNKSGRNPLNDRFSGQKQTK